jgi:succinate dehydrogenase flavin-adding protein (antitoxin of CptAB toxin-antitoxin module)
LRFEKLRKLPVIKYTSKILIRYLLVAFCLPAHTSLLDDEGTTPILPIPQELSNGTPESQVYFDQCLDVLNSAVPLRDQLSFSSLEEARPYMEEYVLPRLFYASDQGWLSNDKSLAGYYRKNWKSYVHLATNKTDTWGIKLLCTPYTIIRQKIGKVATALVFGEQHTLPIPQTLRGGTFESQIRFNDCVDSLNAIAPLEKKKTFDGLEEARSYMEGYVLPRLFHASNQGWLSSDKSLVGYYRENWVSYDNLIENKRGTWGVELLCNPYEIIRQKIGSIAAALIFGEHYVIPSSIPAEVLNNPLESLKIYTRMAGDMTDQFSGGKLVRKATPHKHDKTLRRGLSRKGPTASISGAHFCSIFDEVFGIRVEDLRDFRTVHESLLRKSGAKSKARKMLTYQDATNSISRAFLPRLDWLNRNLEDSNLLDCLILLLNESAATRSAVHNAYFIWLTTNVSSELDERIRRINVLTELGSEIVDEELLYVLELSKIDP